MRLFAAFVDGPVKVAVGVLLVALFGSVALLRMPMQLTPEVQRPTITVETDWRGRSPHEVEREITIEQEEQLKSVEGVVKMSSDSRDSKAEVTLEFAVGTDMDKAVVDVLGRLEQVPEYPEDADRPVINTSNAADRPIAWFILSPLFPSQDKLDRFTSQHPDLKETIERIAATENQGLAMLRLRRLAEERPEANTLLPKLAKDVQELKRFAEDEIEARFERVTGVSQSNVIGGLEDELQVSIDPVRLAGRGLTLERVRQVLRAQNADVSAGDFWETKRRWVVRTIGQFDTPEDVEGQLLDVQDGQPVYVGDVADVFLGYKKPASLVRRFGQSSISINAQRESGANVLDVMDGLRAINQELNAGLLADRGLTLTQVYDETEYIESSVDLVRNNIFLGGALTMIVLMAFLHLGVRTLLAVPLILVGALAAVFLSPWAFLLTLAVVIGAGFWFARGALVVGLAIPTSIIGTFLILQSLDRSLNVISLAGLAFAVGMLVDNAVVVLENIFRRYDSLGEKPKEAAVRGTSEVAGAVLASTITTVAVFLPIVFIEEEAGQLFRDIALAISGAVALSLLVSLTVIPTASALLFRRTRRPEPVPTSDAPLATRSHRFLLGPVESGGRALTRGVLGLNRWVLGSVARQLSVIGGLVGAAVVLSWFFWPTVEYLPTGNRNLVFGILLPPPGYNMDETMRMGQQVEEALRPYWDVDPGSPEAKELDFPVIGDFFFVARGTNVFLGIRAYEPDRAGELIPLVRKVGSQLPGTIAVAKQSSLFERGLTAGRTIEIEITGPDLKQLVGIGRGVIGKVKQILPDAQARPVPSLDLSSPEVHVKPKPFQAGEMLMTNVEIGTTVDALLDGAYAGDYFLEGDKIDLTIRGSGTSANNLQELRALPVATPTGLVVPLDALAEVKMTSGPQSISHRERLRAITIEVSPPPEVSLEEAMTLIRSEIVRPLQQSGELTGGYRVGLAGTADKLRDTWESLRFNVLLALLITYLLMAALFESWLYPLVVILSVPLGAVGGILGLNLLNVWLAFTGQQAQMLDVLTMLGFVILIGTVVNNPILIVHQSLNYIREAGLSPSDAILESVRTRIRPIFMTTCTTILGLLPLVLFPGSGSELYRGLGSVVLGGLAVSTLFTLVLVPTLFSTLMGLRASLLGDIDSGAEFDDESEPTAQHAPEPAVV